MPTEYRVGYEVKFSVLDKSFSFDDYYSLEEAEKAFKSIAHDKEQMKDITSLSLIQLGEMDTYEMKCKPNTVIWDLITYFELDDVIDELTEL